MAQSLSERLSLRRRIGRCCRSECMLSALGNKSWTDPFIRLLARTNEELLRRRRVGGDAMDGPDSVGLDSVETEVTVSELSERCIETTSELIAGGRQFAFIIGGHSTPRWEVFKITVKRSFG